MSRNFNGTSSSIETSTVVGTEPLTFSCMFKGFGTMLSIAEGFTQNRYALSAERIATTSLLPDAVPGLVRSGIKLNASVYDSINNSIASVTGAGRIDEYHHAGAVFNASSRKAFFDGVSGTEQTTAITPTVVSGRTSIGRFSNSIDNNYFNGDLCEVGIWDIILSDAEMKMLANGVSPLALTHRLQNLVLYQDLIRDINRLHIGPILSETATTVTKHNRVFYPEDVLSNYKRVAVIINVSMSDNLVFEEPSSAAIAPNINEIFTFIETYSHIDGIVTDILVFTETFGPYIITGDDTLTFTETFTSLTTSEEHIDILSFVETFGIVTTTFVYTTTDTLMFVETIGVSGDFALTTSDTLTFNETTLILGLGDKFSYSPQQ